MSSGWSDPERVAEYLSREIPHRDIAEGLLLDALPERVGRYLDLGTGDGRMLALVRIIIPTRLGSGSTRQGRCSNAQRSVLARTR